MSNIEKSYEEWSELRKAAQAAGTCPSWYTTPGYQMFMQKSSYKGETVKEAYKRMSQVIYELPWTDIKTANELAEDVFNLMWDGILSPATPEYNLYTNKGLPVSCSSNYIADTVDGPAGFYDALAENAALTKTGHGVASYLSDIRPRGSSISRGGKANGVMPVIEMFTSMVSTISQGSTRRGAWAGYLDIDHGDAPEVLKYLELFPGDLNMGWNITDSFIAKMKNNDPEALKRWEDMIHVKCVTGKGYLSFVDKANRLKPDVLKQSHIPTLKASNLCNEIWLPQDAQHTYSCILASINLEQVVVKDYSSVQLHNAATIARIFLDAVCEYYLNELQEMSTTSPFYDRILSATKKSRATGLGILGYHAALQRLKLPFASYEAFGKNNSWHQVISFGAKAASRYLAMKFGEPEWCRGYSLRGVTDMAIAPTQSSALLCGSTSQSIEPWYSNYYLGSYSSGENVRINPIFLQCLKDNGKYNQSTLDYVSDNKGSCQKLDFLSQHEKDIFRTAFEIDQYAILKQASQRQKYVDQGQSLNLFVSKNTISEENVSKLHQYAVLDSHIKGLYYLRSEDGVNSYSGECEACQA